VKISEYQGTMFHPKTMVVDGVLSTIGSANLDERSFHLNEELNLVVYDGPFAERMRQSFRRDLARARPYTLEMWRKRSVAKRASEWLARPFRAEL
jgi:cardiolipin synthase